MHDVVPCAKPPQTFSPKGPPRGEGHQHINQEIYQYLELSAGCKVEIIMIAMRIDAT